MLDPLAKVVIPNNIKFYFIISLYVDHQGSRIKSEETVFEASTYDLERRRMTAIFTFISGKENERHCYVPLKLMNDLMLETIGEPFKPISIMSDEAAAITNGFKMLLGTM